MVGRRGGKTRLGARWGQRDVRVWARWWAGEDARQDWLPDGGREM